MYRESKEGCPFCIRDMLCGFLPCSKSICKANLKHLDGIIDQFGCKRCQKKLKDVDYKLL